MIQRDGSLDLAALVKARDDRSDQQPFGVRVNVRIQTNLASIYARRNVGAALNVNSSVDAKLTLISSSRKVELRHSSGGVRITRRWFEQPHIQNALYRRMPDWAGEVGKRTGYIQGAFFRIFTARGEPQRPQKSCVPGQVERRLRESFCVLRPRMWGNAPRHCDIARTRLNPVAFGCRTVGFYIRDECRNVVRGKVERYMAILKVEVCSPVLKVENTLLQRDMIRFQIKKCIDSGLTRLKRAPGLRLIR